MSTSLSEYLPAEIAALPRQQRRYLLRQRAKATRRPRAQTRSRRQPHPLAHLFPLAQGMLMSSDSATPPRKRAVVKMARYLIAAELHQYTLRHQRGSWRDWPNDIGREQLKAVGE